MEDKTMYIQCIKDFEAGDKRRPITFNKGNKYQGNKINDHWWVVEQVGINVNDFEQHFKKEEK